jgi:hypothetical protein
VGSGSAAIARVIERVTEITERVTEVTERVIERRGSRALIAGAPAPKRERRRTRRARRAS